MKILPVIHILNEKQAIEQAELIISSNCDGFWLINHGGDDNLTLSLAVTLSERYSDYIVGVNLLSHSPESALNSIIEYNLKYIWLDYAGVHSLKPDEELLTKQKQLIEKNNIHVFAGTAFKYQRYEPNPKKAAELAQSYGLTVTTSGVGTGYAADLNKIKSMSEVSNGNLAIASGLNIDNLDNYHQYIKYALVATGISKDDYYIDQDKLNCFVKKSKELDL